MMWAHVRFRDKKKKKRDVYTDTVDETVTYRHNKWPSRTELRAYLP